MKTLLTFFYLFVITLSLQAQDEVIKECQDKLTRALKLKNNDSIAVAYCRLSEYYVDNSSDSARYYAEKAMATVKTKNSSLYITILSNLADVYFAAGDLDKAYQYHLMARNEASRQRDTVAWAGASTSLGVTYRQKNNLDSALYCYNEALRLLDGREEYSEEAQVLGNIAILYANQTRFDEGILYAKRAVAAAAKSKDLERMMYANYACGSIYFLQRKHDEGIGMLRDVLMESIRQDKPRYILKAYAMMLEMFKALGKRDSVDYYMKKAEAIIPRLPENSQEVLGILEQQALNYMDQGKYRESLNVLEKLLAQQGKGLHIPVDKLYLMMARNYRDLRDSENAAYYYDKAYLTCDSLYAERVNSELSDLTVKYDTKEKELEIFRLNKQQLEQKARTMQWGIVAAVAVFSLLLFILYYMFRQKRIKREEELKLAKSYIDGLERERTRFAKELHDGVCNDLLGIGMQVQCIRSLDESKQELLDLLEQVRRDVRCISHELMPPKFQYTTLAETIEAYVEQLILPPTMKMAFSEDAQGREWNCVPDRIAYETYRILQELLSNILKHSEATEVCVNLSLKDNLLTLLIINDGKAYADSDVAAAGKGIGLTTIQERVKAVNGLFVTDIQARKQMCKLEILLPV